MKNVHTSHCCIKHGCKYGDDDCTVVNRIAPQEYDPCGLAYEYAYDRYEEEAPDIPSCLIGTSGMEEVILTFKTPDVLDQLPEDISPIDKAWIAGYLKYGEVIKISFDLISGRVEVIK